MSALGLIETVGLVAAIEGLDAALKSANVEAIGCEFVGAGIVTVKIRGEIGAVKASIEAAEAAVNKVGTLRTTHVIARTSEEIESMIDNKELTIENIDIAEEIDAIEEINVHIDERIEEIEEVEDSKEVADVEEVMENTEYTREELQNMKVSQLRTVARNLKTKITRKRIKSARKDELIEAILEVIER